MTQSSRIFGILFCVWFTLSSFRTEILGDLGACNEAEAEFRCERSGECMGKSVRCDHFLDCPGWDDSDEKGCNFMCPTEGFFMCNAPKRCISSDLVCDGKVNCEDGFDEFSCNSSTYENMTGTPMNFLFPNFLNEESSDGLKFVYAKRSGEVEIFSWNSSSGGDMVASITKNGGLPVGISCDRRNNLVYWTEVSDKFSGIYRASLDGKNVQVVADTGVVSPFGIAFDWITGNVYFSDSNPSHIAICGDRSQLCSVLIELRQEKPMGIALHPNQGIMFWTNWGATPSVMRAGMDGSNPTTLVVDLKRPNGITVDENNSRIYWADGGSHRIESATFEGRDRLVVVSSQDIHPFDVAVLGERIFWSDWSLRNIKSVDKFSGGNGTVHLNYGDAFINGLAVVHPLTQHIHRSNPCANSSCSHICTLSPTSFRCFCPVGMVLDENNETCVDRKDLSKLVIAFGSTMKIMRFDSIGRDVFDVISIPHVESISDVVYYPNNDSVIICDSETRIFVYNIERNHLSLLVDKYLGRVKGMDIDILGENLYWVEAGRKTVEVMSLRTGAMKDLITNFEGLSDIVVAPDVRSIYVARTSDGKGEIYKMLMNGGSNMSLVLGVPKKEPVALAYDSGFGKLPRLFWADKESGSIDSISLGRMSEEKYASVTVVGPSESGQPTDIVIKLEGGNKLYWTDATSQQLKSQEMLSQSSPVNRIRVGSFEVETNSVISERSNSSNFKAKLTTIYSHVTFQDLRDEHECSLGSPNNKKCAHLCLLSEEGHSGECHCADGYTFEDGDELRCKCSSKDDYTCGDGKCIRKEYICDGDKDCGGGEDELNFNCMEHVCPEGRFKCEIDGLCIPGSYVCDKDKDCQDGSDQRNCTVSCNEESEFRCELHGNCISKELRCNNVNDCSEDDDSDEQGCPEGCPPNSFKCATSQQHPCIKTDWVCDNEEDCEDGSDESNCNLGGSDLEVTPPELVEIEITLSRTERSNSSEFERESGGSVVAMNLGVFALSITLILILTFPINIKFRNWLE